MIWQILGLLMIFPGGLGMVLISDRLGYSRLDGRLNFLWYAAAIAVMVIPTLTS